jgi:hypothetical protein
MHHTPESEVPCAEAPVSEGPPRAEVVTSGFGIFGQIFFKFIWSAIPSFSRCHWGIPILAKNPDSPKSGSRFFFNSRFAQIGIPILAKKSRGRTRNLLRKSRFAEIGIPILATKSRFAEIGIPILARHVVFSSYVFKRNGISKYITKNILSPTQDILLDVSMYKNLTV